MALASRALTRAIPLAIAASLFTERAGAADPFEIQVYDGTASAPGKVGLELHVNHVASGFASVPAPLLPTDHATHFTLEPSLGVLPFWEIGGYFQTALQADGTLHYAGVKLRSKFVTPPGWNAHWRLGINLELAILPQDYDPDRVGGELRPIAAWEDEDWAFAFNPIVGTPLAGQGLRQGPTFEPALMAVRKVKVMSFGLEYYAGLGPIAHMLPVGEEEHYLYEVVNLLGIERLELNAGVGEGLTAGSNRLVFKTIVGYEF